MSWDALDLVQAPAESLLRRLGYEFAPPEALDAERESLAEPVLTKRLDAALRRLNPWINDDNAGRAVRAITQVTGAGLLEANERVHTALVHNLSLEQDLGRGPRGHTIRFLDLDTPENNEFLFSHRYRIAVARQTVVLDLVVFVNGIPLVVIACTSPASDEPLERAKEQMLRCQEAGDAEHGLGVPRLFHTAQIIIATCGRAAAYGTVGWRARDWREWKVPYPLTLDELHATLGRIPTPQDVLLYGMMSKQNLLDLVRNFIVFEAGNVPIRKWLAHYPQFVAVNRIIERVCNRQHATRSGVVWHVPGSGISQTKAFLAHKLRRTIAPDLTLLVVTGRKSLDDQNTEVFRRLGCTNPVQARNGAHLRELLTRHCGQTVMTTAQKFRYAAPAEDPLLNDGDDVCVLIDDTDGTQSLAARMRRALPNAWFIGFTHAPNGTTYRIFEDRIHTYSFGQSVEDRVNIPTYYEPRLVSAHIAGEADGESRVREPRRIEAICLDLIEHFATFIRPNHFKAQLVTCSREAAISYKETLDRIAGPASAVIVSATHRDPERLAKWRSSKEDRQAWFARFRDPDDPLAILVSCDVPLFGLGAPIAQVMYLDAPLHADQWLQAIAQVNRPVDGKEFGLVVDYWGTAPSFEAEGGIRPWTELAPLLESFRWAAMKPFAELPRDDVGACLHALKPEDTRRASELAFRRFARGLDMLLPEPAAEPFIADLKWLGAIRDAARVWFQDERFERSACPPKVRALLEPRSDAARVGPAHATWHPLARWLEDAPVPSRSHAMATDEADLVLFKLLRAAIEPRSQDASYDRLRREQIARLLDQLRALAVVDWLQKEDVQRRMRQTVKWTLREAHLPAASIEALTQTVMVLVRNWFA